MLWLVVTLRRRPPRRGTALKPGQIFTDSLPFDNPVGVAVARGDLGFLDQVVFIGFAAGASLSVASAVLRFRRSRGIERDRMKWLRSPRSSLFAGFVVAVVVGVIAGHEGSATS